MFEKPADHTALARGAPYAAVICVVADTTEEVEIEREREKENTEKCWIF